MHLINMQMTSCCVCIVSISNEKKENLIIRDCTGTKLMIECHADSFKIVFWSPCHHKISTINFHLAECLLNKS